MFISVIVPVYNVEKYLNNCIESILEQTFKDFELVLLTLIVRVENTSIIGSILVIIFYTFITILFYIIKKILKKKV